MDKDFFNSVGYQASDKYYINQDKADVAHSMVKGNAGKMSELLRAKQLEKKRDKLAMM
jgi:hypothetical protein